ncbi:sensor histidine kinase, partial [Paenibacillus sp. MCAF20]
FHGLERKVGDGTVQIDVRRGEHGMIHVSVNDNGIGMETSRLQEITEQLQEIGEPDVMREPSGHGIGIMNIYRRIKLFYGNKADMAVVSRLHEGTYVTVTFAEGTINE